MVIQAKQGLVTVIFIVYGPGNGISDSIVGEQRDSSSTNPSRPTTERQPIKGSSASAWIFTPQSGNMTKGT